MNLRKISTLKYGGPKKNIDVMCKTGKQKTVKVIQSENDHFLNKELI